MTFSSLEKKINILNIIPVFFILGNFVSFEDLLHNVIFVSVSLISIFLFFIKVFFYGINIRVDKTIFYYLFLSALIFYSSLFISSNNQNFYRITFLLITIFVCHSSSLLGDSERIYKNIKNSIFFLTPIILFISVIYSGISLNRMTGFMGNPNAFGRFCVFLIPFYFIDSVKYLKEKQFTLKKLFNFAILFFLIFFTICTTSRGCLLLIFVQIAAFLAYNFNYKNLLKFNSILNNFVFIFLFLALLTCLYYLGLFDQIILKFEILNKFKVANEGIGLLDITNGRTNLAAEIIPKIKENLFGITPDVNNYSIVNASSYIDVHNNYINFAFKYGVLSSLAFHSLFIYLQFYFYFSKEKNILNLIGFVINSQIIVYWIFETASIMFPVWLVIILYTLSKKNYVKRNFSN